MSEEAEYYRRIWQDVALALLATSAKYSVVGDDGVSREESLTDQARRVALLVNMMSLGAGEEGWWISAKVLAAQAIEMDKGDFSNAVAKLVRLGLLSEEPRDNGWWYQLRTARIALGERAMKAARAFARLKEERALAQRQQLLIERQRHGSVTPAVLEELEEVISDRRPVIGDRRSEVSEILGAPATSGVGQRGLPVGSVPTEEEDGWESPNRELGESQPKRQEVGRVPTGPHYRYAGARVDSQISIKSQIFDSGSKGSGGGSAAARGPGVQFRDSEKAMLADEILPLVFEEMAGKPANEIETSRRTWLRRIRDNPHVLMLAVGELKDEMRGGKTPKSRLGKIFTKARDMAKASGQLMRALLCL